MCASIPSRSTASSGRSSIRSSATSGPGRALTRPSFLGAVVIVPLGALAAWLAWGSRGWPLIHDAPLMHYIAWRIANGAAPYRDLFDMNFPGVLVFHLLFLAMFRGGDTRFRCLK